MRHMNLTGVALRLRLNASAIGPVACAAGLLTLAVFAILLWLLPQRAQQEKRQANALAQLARPTPPPEVVEATANRNLALFYASLGEAHYAEQQVKTLFALAAKAGLTLKQGEYLRTVDTAGRFLRYQVILPVKGNYRAVWQFSQQALAAIPFASLDEMSFKRDTIGEAGLDARLRLTIYLDQRSTP